MANAVFSYDELSFAGNQDKLSSSSKGFEEVVVGKQNSYGFDGAEDWGDTCAIDSISFDSRFYQSYGLLDDVRFNVDSPPFQEYLEEVAKLNRSEDTIESRKAKRYPFSLASLELLNNFGNGFKRLTGAKRIKPSNDSASIEPRKMKTEGGNLSAEEIMRIAGEMFVLSSSQIVGGLSGFSHPYDRCFTGLSEEEIKNVQLGEFLLAAAEKVSKQQYERASRLLDQCDHYSSDSGNAVERLVYYFSKALRERIDRETGRTTEKGMGKNRWIDMDEALTTNQSAMASHERIPFSKINQFSGIQAIVENVIESKKIHIIDLSIRYGMQWTLLMEALATKQDSQLELLKITAIGTSSKHTLEETGKRLMSFAQSKNLPFCYKIVMVPDFLELKEELLEVDQEETVAVFSRFILRSLIVIPDRLEHLMKIIATINPAAMVVVETDANHNSPIFVNRFIEALFFFSAYFDCLGECMDYDDKDRRIMESVFFGEGIRNMVVAEGEERKIRNVSMDVWREFLGRYGPEEAEFSMSSLYQANLLLKGCPVWRHCTLEMNGKSLVVCWKGVPIHFVSVWKFA